MIEMYTLHQSEIWDDIVKSFSGSDVYYLSEYVKAFEQNGDGEPLLIYFKNKNTRAINVVIKRDIATLESLREYLDYGEWFDFITPYGYGGFIIEGEEYDILEKEYTEFCKDNNIISEFVRFHPLLSNCNGLNSFYNIVPLGNTVYIDLESEEKIWRNFTSKNRNVIRKAYKSGIQIFWGRDERIIKPFIEIYNKTMDKDNADKYYYFKEDFYKSILESLKYNSMWFYAMKDGEIASIAIFMFFNGNMHYHLSASRKEYQSFAPTNLMIYEASLWGERNGYNYLHLGGGVGAQYDNLYKFKKSFNRNEDLTFHIGKKIFDIRKYKHLCRLRNIQINEEALYDGFFPKYRE